jgi:hypothetical protein
MRFRPSSTLPRLLVAGAVVFLWTASSLAALTGPTLHFDYGSGRPPANPLHEFMYFVPLISPEQVSVSTNSGNTQAAKVLACHCQTNGAFFHATCEFEIVGEGWLQNAFDHAISVRKHEKELKAGKTLAHQLDAIMVQGSGSGSIEVEGVLADGLPAVTVVRMRFNNHGRISPVTICLHDLVLTNENLQLKNETVARVNLLVFRQKAGVPKMEISLASVKDKNTRDGLWGDFVGRLKGVVAGFLIPPITVAPDGHQAMMDFGLALAAGKESFTFPFAIRLKEPPAAALN